MAHYLRHLFRVEERALMRGETTVGREPGAEPQPAAGELDLEGGNAIKEYGNVVWRERWAEIKGWFFVCATALCFLLYGLLMYYVIGDKGPPGWDFGAVADIPGESIYSTNEPVTGGMAEPEPQHVSRKPSRAESKVQKEIP
jgi:hypothetical protein